MLSQLVQGFAQEGVVANHEDNRDSAGFEARITLCLAFISGTVSAIDALGCVNTDIL